MKEKINLEEEFERAALNLKQSLVFLGLSCATGIVSTLTENPYLLIPVVTSGFATAVFIAPALFVLGRANGRTLGNREFSRSDQEYRTRHDFIPPR